MKLQIKNKGNRQLINLLAGTLPIIKRTGLPAPHDHLGSTQEGKGYTTFDATDKDIKRYERVIGNENSIIYANGIRMSIKQYHGRK